MQSLHLTTLTTHSDLLLEIVGEGKMYKGTRVRRVFEKNLMKLLEKKNHSKRIAPSEILIRNDSDDILL
jgi:hypothetical protein